MLPAEPRPADGRAWTSRPSVSAVLAAGWPPNSRCRPPPPLAVIGIAERAIKGLVLGLDRLLYEYRLVWPRRREKSGQAKEDYYG
jgi:hypothetical protein